MAALEHVNLTVNNPKATANMLCNLFDWEIRWEGPAMDSGYTVHVGNSVSYLAVYATGNPAPVDANNSHLRTGLNHIGITVVDLPACEERVTQAGYAPFNHAAFEQGNRFYFLDENNIEYEVVSYSLTTPGR